MLISASAVYARIGSVDTRIRNTAEGNIKATPKQERTGDTGQEIHAFPAIAKKKNCTFRQKGILQKGIPSMGRGMADRSQISACRSSPAVQMWHDECGAHAIPLTDDECPAISATGTDGDLRSARETATRNWEENQSTMVQT